MQGTSRRAHAQATVRAHGKRSGFRAEAEHIAAEVLRAPAPYPHALAFGQKWEILTGEIERHITLRDEARQAMEDERAIRRNRNRALTLLGAFVIGICVTFTLQHNLLHLSQHSATMWAPYAFAITIMLDSGLAAYSWVKRY